MTLSGGLIKCLGCPLRSLPSGWSELECLAAPGKLQELLSLQLPNSSLPLCISILRVCALVFSNRINLRSFLELFLCIVPTTLVLCHTNSSCVRLPEFDICLFNSVSPPCSAGASSSMCLFQKMPPDRKLEFSSKTHFIYFPSLGEPSPALTVAQYLKTHISFTLSSFLVTYLSL